MTSAGVALAAHTRTEHVCAQQSGSSEIQTRDFFYRPRNAWAADFIPFYDKGKFRLFYLHDWRDKEKYGEGVSWYQISTRDFVTFEEHGEMLSRGAQNEQDLYVFTGSVVKADNIYHIFYTGHNHHLQKEGKPVEGIMHAVSPDLLSWKKNYEDTFFTRTDMYEPDDWRDPFVFWNEEAGEYWMLLAARLKNNMPSRRRGCTALCTSNDLKKWKIREQFWSPGLYYTHECPDLFKMGEWWYLVYSTFSERCVTHYRMCKSLAGPWIAPVNDTFDGRAYYAAKTFSDGKRRFVFGWNATRDNNKDYTNWNWGGNLVVHEVVQNADGTLSVKVPSFIDKAFSQEMPFTFSPVQGKWNIHESGAAVNAPDSFASVLASDMPSRCKISMSVAFEKNTSGCGIMLKAGEDTEQAYYVRFEPKMNRLVFDSWPRPGDVPYMSGLERPINLVSGTPYEIKLFVDDTICEVYVNDDIAMSTRMYNHKKGKWGLFVAEGSARFQNARLCTVH